MSTRQANYPFNIYTYEDNVQTNHLGGANDLASAVALAAAHYNAKQSSSMSSGWGVGVDEDEVGLVAYLGAHQGD
jgi:hypothetical protein